MTEHPITPPPTELVQQWVDTYFGGKISQSNFHVDLATRAAQWGADQELEAIIQLAGESALPEEDRYFDGMTVASLRSQRRPKPPSLKEQALEDLHIAFDTGCFSERQADTIRRALEQLDD
jgi:hypothetical protein